MLVVFRLGSQEEGVASTTDSLTDQQQGQHATVDSLGADYSAAGCSVADWFGYPMRRAGWVGVKIPKAKGVLPC